MAELRALLLTDVVDSTALLEQLGNEGMAELWAAHDQLARDLLEEHGGREIDKTDGFLLLFEEVEKAVAYAAAYHDALSSLEPPLRARAGVDFGEVVLRRNPLERVVRGAKPLEVEGLAKPTAARVMSLALAGQTLLTAEAHRALGATSLRTESHGFWRLKGVGEPVELLEVGDETAPFTPPPDARKAYRVVKTKDSWRPVRDVPHSLPRERDAFVGRTADLQELSVLLDDGASLVSVLGVGGTGKTRLVTRCAWNGLGDFPGGAWFCDLSEARSIEGICDAVARSLGVALGQGEPVGQLGHAIASRADSLLILDNFEQVARHASATLGRWLDVAVDVQFIVTSREVLGLPGETSLALPPLTEDEAVALFEARARQAERDFVLAGEDREHGRELVRLLDQLPLAIELAAARVRVMPPQTLLERMSRRFQVLSSPGGRRDRQATLRGALDWSWELLDAEEQSALAQLSVFEGGFTLEAAEGVLELDEAWPMDAVQSLVDKSLVRQVAADRFDLLVSVQEYAAEHLATEGRFPGSGVDLQRAAEHRHGACFAALGAGGARDLRAPDGLALRRLRLVELDNVVTACRLALRRRDAVQAIESFHLVFELLFHSGPWSVALELGEALWELPGLPAADEARARASYGRLLQVAGRAREAVEHLDRAKALLSDLPDDPALHAEVLAMRSRLLGLAGEFEEAKVEAELAVRLGDEARDLATVCRARDSLQMALQGLGDPEGALAISARSVAEGAGLAGDLRCGLLNNHAINHRSFGRMEEAASLYEEALALALTAGHRQFEINIRLNLTSVLEARARNREALEHARAARAVAASMGLVSHVAVTDIVEAGLLRALGRLDEARRLVTEGLDALRRLGLEDWLADGLALQATLALDAGCLEEGRAIAEQGLRIHQALEQADGIAWGRRSLAFACLGEGDLEGSRAHLDAGLSLTTTPAVRAELVRQLVHLELACGNREAAAALHEARELHARAGQADESRLGRALATTAALVEEPER